MNDPLHSRYRYLAFKENGRYRRYIQQEDNTILPEGKLNGKSPVVPAHGSYGALLFDWRWKQKRVEILSRDSHRCVICKSTENLQIHHRQYHFVIRSNQYKVPWDYDDHLLISLCESCHTRGHSKYKVSTLIV